jgi:hypothetical protein
MHDRAEPRSGRQNKRISFGISVWVAGGARAGPGIQMDGNDGNDLMRQLAQARLARQLAAGAPTAPSASLAASAAGGLWLDGEAVKAAPESSARQPAAADADARSPKLLASGAGGHRLDGGAVEAAAESEADHDPLLGVFLSGVKDQPSEAKEADVIEVDCRCDDATFKAGTGGDGPKVFRLVAGEGSLKDRPGGDFERNVRHLKSSASKIAAARARGAGGRGRVWVHCTEGINRGPAGLIAYLLLHTRTPSLEAAYKRVKAARARARCENNTFASELEHICVALAGKPVADAVVTGSWASASVS